MAGCSKSSWRMYIMLEFLTPGYILNSIFPQAFWNAWAQCLPGWLLNLAQLDGAAIYSARQGAHISREVPCLPRTTHIHRIMPQCLMTLGWKAGNQEGGKQKGHPLYFHIRLPSPWNIPEFSICPFASSLLQNRSRSVFSLLLGLLKLWTKGFSNLRQRFSDLRKSLKQDKRWQNQDGRLGWGHV